ncbi:glycosyltransferase 87 family protein [Microlunatus speluncae]|uniref:glycosyltransferase 87 family protein n=1 Tax=Microlunatus speluncae TaxID=2594267 RepID=UPI0012667167|nr:glycosyltransferase 87 family protein [Microlunatus speluncae]
MTGKDRLSSIALAAFWLGSRVLLIWIWLVAEFIATGDVRYYFSKIANLGNVGLSETFYEYPTPVTWILSIPYLLSGGNEIGYVVAYIGFMIIIDAAFTIALWRAGGDRPGRAVYFWLIFVVCVGPLTYLRFDLIPAVLAGGALLALRRVPALAGVLTGIGAAIKLWPALLIAALAAPKAGRRPALIGFAAAGFGLALISLVAGGWQRLISPLGWQSGRGLQIEAVWATPLMLARLADPTTWTIEMSKFQAFEVFGPGNEIMIIVSNVATVLGLAVIIALCVRAFRVAEPSLLGIGLLLIAIVAIMIVTNKTFSPQYLLWLGGPVAALGVLHRGDQPLLDRLGVSVLALAVLTHLIYPVLYYQGMLDPQTSPGMIAGTVVLAIRNVAILIFTIAVCRRAWVALRTAG